MQDIYGGTPAPQEDAGEGEHKTDVDNNDDEDKERFKLHQKRKEKATEAWNLVRPALTRGVVESWALPNDPRCSLCATSVDVSVRCLDCAAKVYYCVQCSNTLHKSVNIFHRLFKWEVRKCGH